MEKIQTSACAFFLAKGVLFLASSEFRLEIAASHPCLFLLFHQQAIAQEARCLWIISGTFREARKKELWQQRFVIALQL